LIQKLEGHPWFELVAVGASTRSEGKLYGEATSWKLSGSVPVGACPLPVGPCTADTFRGCDVVLSALDAEVAKKVEPQLRDLGIPVVSNSSAFRMDPRVPLVIPEVNADHLDLIPNGGGPGRAVIVTNPNCSTTGLALALAPLHRAFGVRRVFVATLQALSGAGAEGPRAIDMTDNVIPFIRGEEEKIEAELGKILAEHRGGALEPPTIQVAAHCHRVPTLDGHLEAVSVELQREVGPEEAVEALSSFRGDVADLGLPSAPVVPIRVRVEPDRPQTRLDRDEGNGMTIVVGRVRACTLLTLRFVVLSHNTIRGAAGGTLLNAELLARRGMLGEGAA
jgi:aspartate-semialdehyde dehydrogenase